MCDLTLQMILLCFCSLSLIVFNIGLQCNLRFLNITVLQGSVATWVNDGGIFDNFFIANLLLSVSVKNFEDRLGCGKVVAKNKVAPFFRTRCTCVGAASLIELTPVYSIRASTPAQMTHANEHGRPLATRFSSVIELSRGLLEIRLILICIVDTTLCNCSSQPPSHATGQFVSPKCHYAAE